MTRFARELERGDIIVHGGRWRTVLDLLVEYQRVRLVFESGETRLGTWTKVRCAA